MSLSGLAKEHHRPKVIIAGGSAYPREIDFARFRQIADAVGALFRHGYGSFRRFSGRRALIRAQSRILT